MKVVSWKTFLVTIIGGVGLVIWKIIHFQEVMDLFMILIYFYIIIEGLILSFSEEAYEKAKKKSQRREQLLYKLFGKFSNAVIFSPFLLILFAILSIEFLPDTTATMILYGVLLLCSISLPIGLQSYISRHEKEENENKNEKET